MKTVKHKLKREHLGYRTFCDRHITLSLWDTYLNEGGKTRLFYELKLDGKVLFHGSDFRVPGYTVIDSDACFLSCASFLALRKGDTDSDYFDAYTKEQVEFRDSDLCEQFSAEVALREEKLA